MRTQTGLTMNGYSSKLSLYDFIVMLMPGSIILYCLMCALTSGCKLFPIDNGFFWIFFFIISYLIGMVNHILSACIFNKMMGFRNCPKMLKDSIQWANENGYDTDVDLEKITTQQCLKDKYYKAYYYARKYAYPKQTSNFNTPGRWQNVLTIVMFPGMSCPAAYMVPSLSLWLYGRSCPMEARSHCSTKTLTGVGMYAFTAISSLWHIPTSALPTADGKAGLCGPAAILKFPLCRPAPE